MPCCTAADVEVIQTADGIVLRNPYKANMGQRVEPSMFQTSCSPGNTDTLTDQHAGCPPPMLQQPHETTSHPYIVSTTLRRKYNLTT